MTSNPLQFGEQVQSRLTNGARWALLVVFLVTAVSVTSVPVAATASSPSGDAPADHAQLCVSQSQQSTATLTTLQQTQDATHAPPRSVSSLEDLHLSDLPAAALSSLPHSVDARVTLPVGVVAGYSRWDDESALENDTRRSLYEAVQGAPGQFSRQLADDLGVSESTVRYHGRILENEQLVQWATVRGRTRLFPANATATERHLHAALNDDATAPLIHGIASAEPVSVSALAQSVDRSTSTVSYHLSRLEDADLLSTATEGRTVTVSLADSTRDALENV